MRTQRRTRAGLVFTLALLASTPGLAVELTEGNLVAVDRWNNSLAVIDVNTGEHSLLLPALAVDGGQYLAFEDDGNIVVTAIDGPQGSGVYRVDPVAGTLTPVNTGFPWEEPRGILVDDRGHLLVAEENQRAVVRIQMPSGLPVIASSGPLYDIPTDLVQDIFGEIYVSDGQGWVLEVSPLGSAQIISEGGLFGWPTGIAQELGGDLLLVDRSQDAVFRVDPETGAQTVLSQGGLLDTPQDVVVEESGDLLVSTEFNGIVRVDPATGDQTLLTDSPSDNFMGLAIVPPAPPLLTISGTCPGNVIVDVVNLTPNTDVAIVSGVEAGSSIIPVGDCVGRTVDIRNVEPLGLQTADDGGFLFLDRDVPAPACGLLIQVVDLGTCRRSNVAAIP